jgi:site-specific recombinase XerD
MSGTRRKAGQLGPHVEGYRVWLSGAGYTPDTIRNMLKELGHVGRWLSSKGLTADQLNDERIVQFLADRPATGRRRNPGVRAMAPLLTYLRGAGIAAEEKPPVLTPLTAVLAPFRGEAFEPAALSGSDISEFLLRECARVSAGSAKGRVAELRSVLRFLYLQAVTALRLGTAVPPVGGWRLSTLPPDAVSDEDLVRLLGSCERSTAVGLRDFAIITVVARLGLRSIEVARLELADVDWRAGELVVRGKGRRLDRLPLPTQVGEALVAYLSAGRNPARERHMFLTVRAPRGPIRADLVGDVVERACRRTGLPKMGLHGLRHALAGDLLRKGAGLVAISQVLRHQDLATTALYAKVDLASLRQVAQPWPGARR